MGNIYVQSAIKKIPDLLKLLADYLDAPLTLLVVVCYYLYYLP